MLKQADNCTAKRTDDGRTNIVGFTAVNDVTGFIQDSARGNQDKHRANREGAMQAVAGKIFATIPISDDDPGH